MSERAPFTDAPIEPTKRDLVDANRRRIISAYKRCFATESGKVVLEDLERVFKAGEHEEWEAKDTASIEEIARRALAKAGIIHIRKQMRATLAPSPQRQRKKKASP